MAEKCVKVGQERDECIFYRGGVCAKPEDVPDECGRVAEKEYETEQLPITKIKVGDKIFRQGYLFEVKKVWHEVSEGVLVTRFACDGVKGNREPPVGYRENITLGGRYDMKIDTVIERDF